MAPHRGVSILVLGILGLVICPLLGIGAWVMGNTDLEEMNRGRMDPTGRDFTRVGRICGIIATALLVLQVVAIVIVAILMPLTMER